MSESVKIISPVDGSVYAERSVARDADIESAVSTARAALPKWRTVPVPERARYMLAFLDALLAMNDDIAVELAWQMGRPFHYGGGEGRGGGRRYRALDVSIARDRALGVNRAVDRRDDLDAFRHGSPMASISLEAAL